jgi:hypothetical protein
VKVHHNIAAFSVTFGEAQPGIVEVLQLLKSHVADTLDTFKPCFEGQCVHLSPPYGGAVTPSL